MKPLKILQVCYSPGWGGLEMYIHRTAPQFVEAGHQVFVAARPQSRTAEACEKAGLNVLPVTISPFTGFGVPKTAGIVRDYGIDVMHAHYSKDLGILAGAQKLAGAGKIVFSENMAGKRTKRDPYHQWVFSNVSKIVSISQYVRKRNLHALPKPESDIQLLYPGVELDSFNPALHRPHQKELRRKFGLPEKGVLVGLLGRISKMKGHETLAQAAAQLTHKFPEAHFVFIGDGEGNHGGDPVIYRQLKEMAQSPALKGRLHFTGFTSEVPEAVSTLDIATCCSEAEAFGYTVVETMAAGLPMVASRSGAMPELIQEGKTGSLFTPLDANELAAKLDPLLANQELRETWGAAAREDTLKRFSMDRHVEEMLALYRQVLATPH